MVILTKESAAKIDKLLPELIKLRNGWNSPVPIEHLINLETNTYTASDIPELKKLLYLIMVEQRKTSIPEIIRGTNNFIVLEFGQPMEDLISAGGFTAIWEERDKERRLSRIRYNWTNFLVIVGILVTYGVSECSGLSKLQHQNQPKMILQSTAQLSHNDSTKKDTPKISLPVKPTTSKK